MLVAAVRGIAQLAALSVVVSVLYRFESAWLLMLWVVALSVVSGVVVVRRTGVELRRWLLPVCGGLLVAVTVVSLLVLAVVSRGDVFLSSRWVVPVTAVVAGHSLMSLVRGVSAYAGSLRSDAHHYEFLLGNGASRLEALRPYFISAVRAMVAPMPAVLSQLSLYTMPLLLAGMLLGGLSPLSAFLLMVLMIVSCVVSSFLAMLLTILFAGESAFPR